MQIEEGCGKFKFRGLSHFANSFVFFLSKETPFLSAEFLFFFFCTNSGSAFFDGLDLRIASNHVETKLATAQTIVELEMHVSS